MLGVLKVKIEINDFRGFTILVHFLLNYLRGVNYMVSF